MMVFIRTGAIRTTLVMVVFVQMMVFTPTGGIRTILVMVVFVQTVVFISTGETYIISIAMDHQLKIRAYGKMVMSIGQVVMVLLLRVIQRQRRQLVLQKPRLVQHLIHGAVGELQQRLRLTNLTALVLFVGLMHKLEFLLMADSGQLLIQKSIQGQGYQLAR